MWGFRSNRLAIAVPQPRTKERLPEEEGAHDRHLGEEEEQRSYSGCLDSKMDLKLGLVLDLSWDSM
jgi:hypothetical protein